MIDIYYNDNYVIAEEDADTTRKSLQIANELQNQNIEIKDPEFSETLAAHGIHQCHSPEYVESLITGQPEWLAESNHFKWDPKIWDMAVSSTAGLISACSSALVAIRKLPRENWKPHLISGSLSSGLHHASTAKGDGYCTVNGLAITSFLLEDTNITILDFDAHCGGGTVSMLRDLNIDHRVHQYDISTNMFDSYEIDDTHNITISTTDEEYQTDVQTTLDYMVDWEWTELILYNAGVDPYPEISTQALQQRDKAVFNKCITESTPCAFVLAGGYTTSQTEQELVQTHINTIHAAIEACKD